MAPCIFNLGTKMGVNSQVYAVVMLYTENET